LKGTKDNIFSAKHSVQNLQIVENGLLLEDYFCIITAIEFSTITIYPWGLKPKLALKKAK
jgi:hypothetical protein